MNRKLIQFLVVFVGLLAASWGAWFLLISQGMPRAGWIVAAAGSTLAYFWLLWGLWSIRQYRAAKAAIALILSGTIAIALSEFLFFVDRPISGIMVRSLYTMAAALIVGLWLIRTCLSPGHPVTGVARTLIDEAVRMKVVLVLIIGVLLLVPLLPILTDTEAQLRYRIQTFLTYSLSGMSLLLSLLTIFLACGTVCWEMKDKQIFLTMSKPVGRGQYLMGKWLGISLLNLLLVTIIGVGVYNFAKILQSLRANTPQDRIAVDNQLMVAREAHGPQPLPEQETALNKKFQERVEQLRKERQDSGGAPLTPKDFQDAQMVVYTDWYTLGPGESETYVFRDLSAALKHGEWAQLRLVPQMAKKPEDDTARMALWLNDDPYPYDYRAGGQAPINIVVKTPHVLDIHLYKPRFDAQGNVADFVSRLDKNGDLTVTIKNTDLRFPNVTPPSSINFAPSDGIQILYRVDTFENNLLRTLAILWLRLVFLAILGITAGTFLGFPVACLLCLMVYFVAISSAFLGESLSYFGGTADKNAGTFAVLSTLAKDIWTSIHEGKWAFLWKEVVRFFAELGMSLVPAFGFYSPVPKLADGRNVSVDYLLSALLWIGVIWSGLCAVIGWYIFRRRELAQIIT